MKEPPALPQEHHSYSIHRRQYLSQIFLPIIVAIVIIIALAALTGVAAFGANGNATRWSAVSTIWLLIPVLLFGLIFLAILSGLVYLLARILKILPNYTFSAQYYANLAASKIKHFSNMATRPVFFVEEIKASLKEIFGRN